MAPEPVWITEQDVVEALDLPAAIDVIGGAFRAEAGGEVASMSKTHLLWGDGHSLHAIGGVDERQGLVGTKTWAHTGSGATPLLVVWDVTSGALRAVIEAFALGQLRTSAVSGVATRHLAQPDADHLAVIGSGRQALGQVAAVAAVRPIRRVTVYSPTLGNRERFAGIVEGLDLGCRVECSPSVQSAVDGAHVVTTVTRARQPFLEAGMLAPGAHVNAVGAVTPERRELATDVAARSKVVVADGVDAARRLAVELSEVEHITPLCDVVAAGDRFPGGDGSTVFKSMGVGLADLALGGVVLARCATSGRGRPLVATRRATPQLKEMS